MNAEEARLRYLRWLSKADPAIYSKAMAHAATEDGLGDLGWINFVIQGVLAAGSLVMQKKQSDKAEKLAKKQIAADQASQEAARADALKIALLDTNTKRAAAGLPPVDINGKVIPDAMLPAPAGQLAQAYTPQAVAAREAGFSIQPMYLVLGGVALIAVIYLLKK